MKKLTLLLLSTVALGACKKDSENTPTLSKTELLTNHSWKQSSIVVTVAITGQAAYPLDLLDECNKDDSYKFNTNLGLVVDAGTDKCDSSDPQKETGSWALSNGDRNLTIKLPGQVFPFNELNINELSAKTLRVSGSQSVNGSSYTIDATFVAQ
jgi:hypothetical protein